MSEFVGLTAVLNLDQFNRNYASYTKAINSMNADTLKAAQGINSSTSSMGSSLGSAFKSGISESLAFGNYLNNVFLGILKKVAMAAGLAMIALIAMGKDPVSQAADLEKQLSRIAAVLNMTNDQAGFLKDVVMELGLDPTLAVTTVEAAQAIELLAKNGIFAGMSLTETKQAAMDAGKAVVFLSNATGADFAQAANIAASAMSLFGLRASDLIGIVSSITSVTTNSKFTIHDYELALRNGGAAAAAFGVSLEDFNTVVATTADELGTGMKDGTSFANMLYRLTPNTQKAEDAMRDLGLITADGSNQFFDAEGNLKGVNDIAKLLYQTFEGSSTQMVEVNGRTAAQNALLGELRDEYGKAQATVADYTTGVKGMLATEDEKNKALEEANKVMGILGPQISGLEGITGEYVETLNKLTVEEKLMAIETIFGRDALGAVLGTMKEGAPVVANAAEIVSALGVSYSEAAQMITSGMTEFELAQQIMAKTDAQKNAITRLDNLRGSMEKFKSVVEAVVLDVGYQFLEFLTIIVDKMRLWMENNEPLIQQIRDIAIAIGDFFTELVKGEDPMWSFIDLLKKIGGIGLAVDFLKMAGAIMDFTTPIIAFVDENSEAIIGAFKAIGLALLGLMIASAVASALSLIISPVTLIIALIGGLGAAWETNFGGIRDKVYEAKDALDEFGEKLTGIKDFKFDGLDSLKSFGSALQQTVEDLGILGTINAIFQDVDLGAILSELGKNVGTALKPVVDNIKTEFGKIDWTAIGTAIRTKFLEIMGSLGENAGEGINFIAEWVGRIDWAEVGDKLKEFFIGALLLMLVIDATIIEGLYNFFKGLFESVDWATLGTTIKDFIFGLLTGWVQDDDEIRQSLITAITDLFSSAGDAIETWFVETDTKIDTWVDENIIQPVLSALTEFSTSVGTTLDGWWTPFNTWFVETDTKIDTWVDENIIQPVLSALTEFSTSVGTTLDGWWTAFNTWVQGVTWEDIGYWATTAILEVFIGFPMLITETLNTWGTAFYTWFTETDWTALGTQVNDKINAELKTFWPIVLLTFNSWWDSIQLWFTETDWTALGTQVNDKINAELAMFWAKAVLTVGAWWTNIELWFTTTNWKSLATKVITALDTELKTFWSIVLLTFNSWWDSIQLWFTETDWDSLGTNIVDGIIAGITGKLADAQGAILAIAAGVKTAWDDFWATHSPSKLMMESGANIMEGVGLGFLYMESKTSKKFADIGRNLGQSLIQSIKDNLEEGGSLLNSFLSLGSSLSGIGSSLAGMFTEKFITPLQSELGELNKSIQDMKLSPEFLEAIGMTLDDFNKLSEIEAKKLVDSIVPDDLRNEGNVYLSEHNILLQERIALERELAGEIAHVTELEKTQADLKLLQSQADLLKLIKDNNLSTSILDGLELGLDVNLQDILKATAVAMQEIIKAAEGELEIASPSKVFASIGKNVLLGMKEGLLGTQADVVNTIGEIYSGFISSSRSMLPGRVSSNPVQNTSNSSTQNYNVSNSFAGNPQITDATALELTLAGYR